MHTYIKIQQLFQTCHNCQVHPNVTLLKYVMKHSSQHVRSDQKIYRALSGQAVVAHACHGHRCRPSLAPLSGTAKNWEGRRGGGPPALAGTREYHKSIWGW